MKGRQLTAGRSGRLADLAPIAAAHHERLDGTGYPLGVEDEQIRRETRISTGRDYFDALTSDRPYRAAMPVAEAMVFIEAEVGTAIDGYCYEALRSVV